MTTFTGTFSAVAVTAAQDCFELVAATNARVRIRDIKLAQYTDFGDAAAEILSVNVIRGFTVAGTGGSTVTPSNVHPWSRTSDSTVLANNTTVANTGTGAVLIADAFNIAAGWSLRDVMLLNIVDPHDGLWLEAAQRLVVRITAPADSLTMNGTIVFEEHPQRPQ